MRDLHPRPIHPTPHHYPPCSPEGVWLYAYKAGVLLTQKESELIAAVCGWKDNE